MKTHLDKCTVQGVNELSLISQVDELGLHLVTKRPKISLSKMKMLMDRKDKNCWY